MGAVKSRRPMRAGVRIALALAIGFAGAMAYMAVVIWLGYRRAYSGGGPGVAVRAFGIRIYDIVRAGRATPAPPGARPWDWCAASAWPPFWPPRNCSGG